jgi:hypothetical protein
LLKSSFLHVEGPLLSLQDGLTSRTSYQYLSGGFSICWWYTHVFSVAIADEDISFSPNSPCLNSLYILYNIGNIKVYEWHSLECINQQNITKITKVTYFIKPVNLTAFELDIDNQNANYTLGMQTSVARRGRWYTDREYPYYFRPGPEVFRWVQVVLSRKYQILTEFN